MIQMVKNNRSFCPPVVASKKSTQNDKWTTVVNCKSPMRKFSNKESNAILECSPNSVLLNTSSLFYDHGRVLKSTKQSNGSVVNNLNKNNSNKMHAVSRLQKSHNMPRKKDPYDKNLTSTASMETTPTNQTTLPLKTPDSIRRKRSSEIQS